MSKLNVTFDNYLKTLAINKGESHVHTHTRIGDHQKIHGGIYNIQDKDRETFLNEYFNAVFVKKKKEYLTEKQRQENAPFVIDIDIRYSTEIKTRQHTKEHIVDLLDIYARTLSTICDITNNFEIEIFVMEKDNVNILDTKTKDGIHIIFGILMDKQYQLLVRERVLNELTNCWGDLPMLNTKEDLIDEGVTRGTVNWQMYGSRKPHHEAYLVKYHYTIVWNQDKVMWDYTEHSIKDFDTKSKLEKLSVHYNLFPKLSVKDEYKAIMTNKKKKANNTKQKTTDGIKTEDDLDCAVKEMLAVFDEDTLQYEFKETHEYTMILPRRFWDEGSYEQWIRVGWALKNTNKTLLSTWLKFSSQQRNFDWSTIPNLITMWNKFEYNNPDGLTSRSIMYWAKHSNPSEYSQIRKNTIGHYIELTIKNSTEWDLAQVLYQMCKDKYVCVSIKNNIWYEFVKHRWCEIDSGNTLRLLISKGMHDDYMYRTIQAQNKLTGMDDSESEYEPLRKRINRLSDICILLKRTTPKNNIMKEAKELFYDKTFINKLDSNSYLLCFNNLVVDFKEKCHRTGQPDDYISKCTNIDYIPYDDIYEPNLITEIKKFVSQLFPDKELKKYMWEHLASTLIGNNDNQTFNIYTGSGRNGKSKLVDLMSKVLGDYKATVPITLVTQKRNAIGSTSSEIVQLMGVRYAVMQEPSKGDIINEGIMKEITGGDPIQGRALFKEAVTFIPQFKLVVCTNTLFDIKSNDDGTWRRIRVCDFMSKFLENPYTDEVKFPKDDYPHQYPIDKKIDEKFNKWAPVMASMLVNLVYETMGEVKDCKIVLASSDNYREEQDYLAEFAKDKVVKNLGGKIKKTELTEVFKEWYIINYGKALPKMKELSEYMNKKYGKYKKGGWSNISINYDDEDDDEDDNDNDDNDNDDNNDNYNVDDMDDDNDGE